MEYATRHLYFPYTREPLGECVYEENSSDKCFIPCLNLRKTYGNFAKFFPSFYGPSAKRAGHENKEGKNEDP